MKKLLKKKNESRINAVEMPSLRNMCGVFRKDRCRDSDVESDSTQEADNAPVTPLGLRVSVGGGDHSLSFIALGTRQKVAHEVFGSRTPAIKMMMVFPASGAMMEISGRNEVKEFFRVCPAVHAIEHAQRPRLFARPTG
ncbi:hypothetical protein EVAR_91213_1 [Eumeta japonica]|uniref:Uncharacterized protein n=1 Tax=Eumeta variegata TaxID=151549 RepID=A0A4C2ABR1_EUMVA|nr:hypothetical protein EVAR_91213_1 [Eumeta japonica]